MSDAAIATICGAVIQVSLIVIGFLTLWIKLKYGVEKTESIEKKTQAVVGELQENTLITRNAVEKTEVAKVAATEAAKEAKEVKSKLNGGVDAAIEAAIRPVRQTLEDHALQDEQNMEKLCGLIEDLKRKVLAR